MRFERHAEGTQAKSRTAALIRNRKAVTTYSGFATVDNSEANTSRANDHNTSVISTMCAKAGDGRVICIANGPERVWPGNQGFEQSFAANTGQPDDRIHLTKCTGRQSRVGYRSPAGALDRCQ